MKKFFCVLYAALLLLSGPTVIASADETADQSVINGCHTIEGQKPLLTDVSMGISAKSVFLYETNSQTVMYAQDPDARVYPASLVKIMTALIALEKGDLADAVTVTKEALATVPYGAVVNDLKAGEVLTLEDLLYCMMVGSGNDAAIVIAEHISGTQAAFVQEMNRYAQNFGCKNTNFANVHGLHDDAQYTTARDVAKILSAAIKNERFCTIFGAISYTTVPVNDQSVARELYSANYLMKESYSALCYDSRVTGGRTGVTDSGTRCIAAVANSEDLCLLSIIMEAETDSNDRVFVETKSLLDAGFNGNRKTQLLYAGQILKQDSVTNGDCLMSLGTNADIFTILPDEISLSDLEITYSYTGALTAPVEKGSVVAYVQFIYNGMCVAQSELTAMNTVWSTLEKDPTFVTVEQDTPEDNASYIIWLAVAGVVIAAVVIFILLRLRIRRSDEKMLGINRRK